MTLDHKPVVLLQVLQHVDDHDHVERAVLKRQHRPRHQFHPLADQPADRFDRLFARVHAGPRPAQLPQVPADDPVVAADIETRLTRHGPEEADDLAEFRLLQDGFLEEAKMPVGRLGGFDGFKHGGMVEEKVQSPKSKVHRAG